jgi:hypothetical protein
VNILLLNQTFYPDVVSSGQHASDLAVALAAGQHQVTVIASKRAYDDPAVQFSGSETWKGVKIERAPCLNPGKRAKWRRAVHFASFLLSCSLKLAQQPRQDIVIAMTSPPLISFFAAIFVKIKGGCLISWIMDLNPDEAIAAGWLRKSSLVAKFLNSVLRYGLRTSDRLIVMDRFMKLRLEGKGVPSHKIVVVPPWSHDEQLQYSEAGRDNFRKQHGLEGHFVVMYSGNHSPCHPLDSLLQAALALANDSTFKFCFVGGGSEFEKVTQFTSQHGLRNVVCLPYQPLDHLSASLSAADLHIVVLGEPFVGIVHPCKIYNVLRLGIPFLYIGPEPSHITDMNCRTGVWRFTAKPNNVNSVVQALWAARENAIAHSGDEVTLAGSFSQSLLMPRMVDVIEAGGIPSLPAEGRHSEVMLPRGANTSGSSVAVK